MTTNRSFEELVQTVKDKLSSVIEPGYHDTWLGKPHALLENRSPLQLLREKGEAGFQEIDGLIEASKQGVYS